MLVEFFRERECRLRVSGEAALVEGFEGGIVGRGFRFGLGFRAPGPPSSAASARPEGRGGVQGQVTRRGTPMY